MATTYKVKSGDTLWEIAKKYLGSGYRWTKLADWNNIPRSKPTIYPGQILKLDAGGSSGSPTTPSDVKPPTSSTKATIVYYGLQAGTDRSVYAVWSWDRTETENYQVKWYYSTGQNGIWFVGTDSTVDVKQSVYSAPENALSVRFVVKPISKTHTVNKKETSYWTAEWSTEAIYDFSSNPPSTPPVPTVEIKDYTLKMSLENLDLNGDHIKFDIVQDDVSLGWYPVVAIKAGHASYSYKVEAGHTYKVRCKALKGPSNVSTSNWSAYSTPVTTKPAASAGIGVCRATSETSVLLEWVPVVNADTYDIQYTTKLEYFEGSDQLTDITGIETTRYEKTGLESGQEYFFRVRAVNDKGASAWTAAKSVIIGKTPAAPTTWSSTTTGVTGDIITLYWVHNAEDGSAQRYAEIELYIDGVKETHTINSTEEKDDEKTTSYVFDTSLYIEGTKIQWRVRTAGVTNTYGDFSIQRTIDIYSPPTMTLKLTDVDGNSIETLTSYPLYISAVAGPNTQTIVGWHVSIISNDSYESVDNIGNVRPISAGQEVYSKHFDISEQLTLELSAGHVDLANNISYTVIVTVAMNSGLTAEATANFTVSWKEEEYVPNAEISINKDNLTASIRPYCNYYPLVYYLVNNTSGMYLKTSTIIEELEGNIVEGVKTTTDEFVFSGTNSSGETIYFCTVTEEKILDGVTLAVYRREFDGRFTELATGLSNDGYTFITDPHPSLDFARYRIVATVTATGAVGYYDVPGYPVGESSIIIQWDEDWSSFDTTNEDALEQQPWSGSLLKLPYNVDVADNNNADVSLVEYIGRSHPVSYYGTQLGETATWRSDIAKSDKATLYALRRLARWMGDVYVREPSGSGYWANIAVSFNQRHCELTVPVNLSIKRVSGGA